MTARRPSPITFDVGYPLSIAAVDVQNRVAQAAASLPAIVNQGGVIIKKQNPNFVLIVNLISPDRSVDPVALSNYAYLQVVDPLKRVPGVGDVQIFGERRYSMRLWLDPDKLAKLGITAVDVQQAVAEQNVQVAAGKIGQSPAPEGTPFEMQVNATGRLSDPEQFGDIVLRSDPHERGDRADARRRARSSSARCNIPRPRCSARIRPWCWRCSSCRAPTRSTCSSRSRTRWTNCRSASRRESPTACITTPRGSSGRPSAT